MQTSSEQWVTMAVFIRIILFDACLWNGWSTCSGRYHKRYSFECGNTIVIRKKMLHPWISKDLYIRTSIRTTRLMPRKLKANSLFRREGRTGVIFSNCFFFGLRRSSGFPSILDENKYMWLCEIHLKLFQESNWNEINRNYVYKTTIVKWVKKTNYFVKTQNEEMKFSNLRLPSHRVIDHILLSLLIIPTYR